MKSFEKKLRTTAYLESDLTRPLCRHYCDAYGQESELLLDILDAGMSDSCDMDSNYAGAILSPLDVMSRDEMGCRLAECEAMLPNVSAMNRKGIHDLCLFVGIAMDAHEHHGSPVIFISMEV